ncbi:MAG TPA: phosphoribosylanthranilate isomerase [Methylomirabilota bacterium]|nr:phosphoribosylanthranilate isomerase [Methylomirabilota bacterium]
MVRIKICGITKWEDAKLAADLGADAIGLNLYEQSPRCVTPFAATEILRRLPPFVAAVGVFVNWEEAAVVALAKALRLGAAQLHGDEPARVVERVAEHMPVIKALRLGQAAEAPDFAKYRAASAFLLDAAVSGHYGGTGTTGNWHSARSAAQTQRILLAGGLTPENVGEAIRIVRPYAVDVASGVEARPGKKDPAKMKAFFEEVGRASREIS